jgi:hypothetical protein
VVESVQLDLKPRSRSSRKIPWFYLVLGADDIEGGTKPPLLLEVCELERKPHSRLAFDVVGEDQGRVVVLRPKPLERRLFGVGGEQLAERVETQQAFDAALEREGSQNLGS